MFKYFDQILSKYQCGFRRGYNTQHCLLVMAEKNDKGILVGALLSFIFSYLNERKQRIKIHNSYSPYVHIECGVPHGQY